MGASKGKGACSRRVLVVGPSWVGDMVMAQTLFKVLRQREPRVEIDVLAPAWSRPLIERMPEVRRAIDMPVGHGVLGLAARFVLARRLVGERYGQAILLPNSFKSALVPVFAGIPLRTGWRGEMRYGLLNDLRLLDKKRYPLMVERFAALAYPPGENWSEPLPRPKLRVDGAGLPVLLARLELSDGRPVLVICPGAEFGPAKRWPEEYFARVAEDRIAGGWQVWLLGSERDRPVTGALHGGLSSEARVYCHDLAGRTRLEEAIDLMSTAAAVVSNDSGLMHIAAALGRPLVVVYGSSSPAFTPPLAERVRTLSIPVDCGPCFKRDCPLSHTRCLSELPPERVLSALDEVTRG